MMGKRKEDEMKLEGRQALYLCCFLSPGLGYRPSSSMS